MPLIFVRRGSVSMNQMPRTDRRTIAGLSDEELFQFQAGWKPDRYEWALAAAEIRRRENWIARWALAVSILSLVVAFAALFVRQSA